MCVHICCCVCVCVLFVLKMGIVSYLHYAHVSLCCDDY